MPTSATGEYRPHPTKVSQGRRLAVYLRDNWTCQYCGRVFIPRPENLTGRYAPWDRQPDEEDSVYLELDHIHPRALGGDNSEKNLRAACTPCNKRKLATTRHTKWDKRISLALDALTAGPADEGTAKKAAALLLGCLQGELPRMRGDS